jgi:dimethylargininase
MSFHAFSRAIVRTPSHSVVEGLRAVDVGAPSHEGVLAEHAAYVRALEALGVNVETLPALEAFPDSVFVEDTALVFSDAAILLRPGAATRRGEAAEIAATLARNFERVLQMEDGTAEGGDVLSTPRGVFIGASARTSVAGAAALVSLLAEIGRQGVVVTTPPGVLHLKSDCSLLDDETILCTPRLAAARPFSGFRLILTPDGEEGAANALRIGGAVLLSEGYPQSAELLDRSGYAVTALKTAEIAKIDAGLSCMSLRWRS